MSKADEKNKDNALQEEIKKEVREEMKDDMKKAVKKAEKRGKRKGFFARIRSFFIGVLVGILIITGVSAYLSGLSFIHTFKSFFTRETAVEGHDMTLGNWGFFGYKTADFADAILGDEKELTKLEVYSREVTDVATLTQAGFAKIKAFSKYQYITYHGTATYTVDLSGLTIDNFELDKENKLLIMKVPDVVLEPLNIPSENIEFGEVEKNSIFAFGDIKVTPEQQAEVETEAKKRMEIKLTQEDVAEEARSSAEHALWEIYQPIVNGVSGKYMLKVMFLIDDGAQTGQNAAAEAEASGDVQE